MAVEITLVRHAETTANAGGIWQGRSDSPLTDLGAGQVTRLAKRLATHEPFDLMVTSPLGRARTTADALGVAESDERWSELDIGSWEGLTEDEILERDGEVGAVFGSGEDVAFRGGEKVSDMVVRLTEALRGVTQRLDDGQRGLVVGHGGALLTLIGALFGVDSRGHLGRLTNTGITTIRFEGDDPRVLVFNDASHLPGAPVRAEAGATHVVLARHGQTIANTEGRWQGQTGGTLTALGIEQANRLGSAFPDVDVLYSSPLDRALHTARLVAEATGVAAQPEEDLKELGFGRWEMMTRAEIEIADPLLWKEFVAGVDAVRGGTGETFAGVRDRVAHSIGNLADKHRGQTIGVVSHGGATRAYATGILGLEFSQRSRLGLLNNTGMARVVYGRNRPMLANWNLTPHLRN